MSDIQTENIWPPAPKIEPIQVDDPVLSVLEFKHQSTWLVFLATLITLGIYQSIWLYKVSKKANTIWPNTGVAPETFLLLAAMDFLYYIADFMNKIPLGSNNIIGSVLGITLTLYTFKVRNQINIALGNDRAAKYWMGALGTFFLGPLYLNYQKNRAIEAAKALEGAG